MKKFWLEPEIGVLDLNMTANDLKPGDKEDDMSYVHGFPAWDCHCS